LRPSEAPGVLVARPTGELLPGGSTSEAWRATGPDDALEVEYEAGGAWASVDGKGTLGVSLDGGRAQMVPVDAPGAYELTAHECHERHRLALTADGTLSVYSVGFAAGRPEIA